MTDSQSIIAEIAAHHRQYGPSFGPSSRDNPTGVLSDHLPMAALARIALGDNPANVLGHIERYRLQLSPIDDHPDYHQRLDRYLIAIQRHGVSATLAEHLPRLISGWVRDAYHPLIRIAYGWEFGIEQEVAAGLAYLESPHVGADARLAQLAASATYSEQPPEMLFAAARQWRPDLGGADTFTHAAQRVIDAAGFADAALVFPDNLRRVSRIALNIFAATHNFFALHLVTGSHAFRLLYEFAGPHADAILNLGLVAGYAAVGAPPINSNQGTPSIALPASVPIEAARASLLGKCADDEHDHKVAYSAVQQASHFADRGFLDVARAYLGRERTRNNG